MVIKKYTRGIESFFCMPRRGSCWGPSLWSEGGRLIHPGQEGGSAGGAGRRSGLKRLSGEKSYRGGAGGVDCLLVVVLLVLARFFFSAGVRALWCPLSIGPAPAERARPTGVCVTWTCRSFARWRRVGRSTDCRCIQGGLRMEQQQRCLRASWRPLSIGPASTERARVHTHTHRHGIDLPRLCVDGEWAGTQTRMQRRLALLSRCGSAPKRARAHTDARLVCT